MRSLQPTTPQHLRIHQRQTGARGRDSKQRRCVYCTSSGACVPVSDCLNCGYMFGMDRRAGATFLLCRDPNRPTAAIESQAHADDEPAHATVSEVMSSRVVCVRSDLGIDSLLRLLNDEGISGVPVVDANGKAIGVVTRTDLLRLLDDHAQGDAARAVRVGPASTLREEIAHGFHVEDLAPLAVREIMTPLALSIHESVPIAQAAAIMAYEGVHRMPVLGEDGTVVGLISSTDVMRWVGRGAGYVLPHGDHRGA